MRLSLTATIAAIAAVAVPATAAPPPPAASPLAPTRTSLAASSPPAAAQPAAGGARPAPAPVQHYVDLNNASRNELMKLPGIGASEAERIIANRPYLTKTELVSKGVLPVGPFLSLKHLVVAMPKTAPKGKA